ncbi:MAG: TonB-dependent receptor [Pseudomonadota bacterium]
MNDAVTSLLSGACVLAIAIGSGAAPAHAQNEQDEARDEIIVTATPIRDSQAAALRRKRDSDNVVDIISADTIGRFPDQNLADSLGRVPGLAIERDQGQARFINFRGAPFRYTSIAFDGINVPGAENGRIPRFDSIPAAVTSSIEVNKAITPDMPGEATIGYININTFKPFDSEGFRLSMEGGYGLQGLGNVGIERVNGRVSWSNETFGILGFGSRNKRGRITDNREYELSVDPATGGIIPDNLDFRSYRGERVDNAYGGRIEVRPSDNVQLFVSSIYNEFVDLEERNQFDFDITEGLQEALNDTSATPTPDRGYSPLVSVTRLLEDGKYTNSTWTSTAGADVTTNGWDIKGRVNYTETRNEAFLPIPFSSGGEIAASYDVTDILDPQLTVFAPGTTTPIDINDITYSSSFGLVFANALDIESLQIKFDGERDVDFLGGTRIKTGIQIDLRDATGGDTLVFGGFPSDVDIASFNTGVPWDTGFSNTINATNYDNIGIRDAWEASAGGLSAEFDAESIIGIDENIFAFYAMATTDFSWGNIVYGARIEHTEFETEGNQLVDGAQAPITADNSYTFVLPSVHVNIDVAEDVKLRFSGTTGISRPTYSESRASVSVDAIEFEIEGGNPTLDAENSIGADVSLEYYFASASILSVGGFVRFIDDVIYADTTTVADGSALAPGLIDPNTPTLFNSFFNGEDGQLLGLEANLIGQATFLPGPFDGLGLATNVTIVDSEFSAPTQGGAKFSLPGTSDVVFNASVFYEKFGVSARVNYQYRDAWLSTTENDSLTEFWGATERVDASVRYTLPVTPGSATITLFADGNNLTDERDLRYVNTPATPNQYEGFGRRFVAGARIDF